MRLKHRLTVTVLLILFIVVGGVTSPAPSTSHVIVQGDDATAVRHAVESVGASPTHDLAIIDAVAVELTPGQLRALLNTHPTLRVYDNAAVHIADDDDDDDDHGSRHYPEGTPSNSSGTFAPDLIDTKKLHQHGITGEGVTIAFIDTGIEPAINEITFDHDWDQRIAAYYDAIADDVRNPWLADDDNGHGTHVVSVAVSRARSDHLFEGVAPGAEVVIVRGFGDDGSGSYADIIRGINWVVTHRNSHSIDVLNLSFSTPPQSYYWDDPLNQAVMEAWRAGITVVVSAGNTGPDPMTVGVPGNVPYVITVGATTDNYTVYKASDDVVASFSATGPTVEGFVKPDIVAPGGHLRGLIPSASAIVQEHPQYAGSGDYYTMSGTSQSAAVVSGVVALMLDADPTLTPDAIKCRLMASAHTAVDKNGSNAALAFSIFQQGAGTVNAYDAVYLNAAVRDCANNGLNIDKDLAGIEHYGGRAKLVNGEYTIPDLEGYDWSGSYLWNDLKTWSGRYIWTEGLDWSDGDMWTDRYVWTEGYVWTEAYIWTEAQIAINGWVPQE
ncbi:MAG: S8 family peptidase [Chloroflexi bacterium]|nr:S8 family peptidase [Chloroflexota bacterium]